MERKSIFTTYSYEAVNGKVVRDEYKKFVDNKLVEHRDGLNKLEFQAKEKCSGKTCSKPKDYSLSPENRLKLAELFGKFSDFYNSVDLETLLNKVKNKALSDPTKNVIHNLFKTDADEDFLDNFFSKKCNNNCKNDEKTKDVNNKLCDKCNKIIEKFGYGSRISYKGHKSDLEKTITDLMEEEILEDVKVVRDELTNKLSITFVLKNQDDETYELLPTKNVPK